MFTGHVDTVRIDGAIPENMKFRKNGDTLTGPGVYDMKAGIMGMMDVMRRVHPRKNMKVVAAFLCDEEHQSAGARRLMEYIENQDIPKPDLIFSPEIPTPFAPLNRSDLAIVHARRGHVKYDVNVQVPKGHGALGSDVPDAITEGFDLLLYLKRDWFRSHPRIVVDPTLLREDFDIRSFNSKESDALSLCDQIRARLSHMTIRGTSIRQSTDLVREALKEYRVVSKLAERGVVMQVTKAPDQSRTSYEPYGVLTPQDQQGDHARRLSKAVEKIYGRIGKKPLFIGGKSTSDANIFANKGLLIYESSAEGGGEHSLNEWVSERSVARNIDLMAHLASGEFLKEG